MTRATRNNLLVGLAAAAFGSALSASLTWYFTGDKNTATASDPNDVRDEAAGCLVTHDGKMLGVFHNGTGLFGPPAGRLNAVDNGDPKKTALRETLAETGLRVRVLELLEDFHERGTKFHLYACALEPGQSLDLLGRSNVSDESEVLASTLLDPTKLPQDHWRFPAQARRILYFHQAMLGRSELSGDGSGG